MALDLKAVGRRIGPLTLTYGWKDVALYALGVGAGFSEIDYCYEKALKVIPTFAAAALGDFTSLLAGVSGFNPAGVLHGEQEFIFHRPIPPEGTLITEGAIVHCFDKGRDKGALVVAEFDTRQSGSLTLFTSVVTMFARLDGGFGGSDAPKKTLPFPDRPPDAAVQSAPAADLPLIYRLSGDTFGLHADAEAAQAAGFEKPIMHGLCTLGHACRALIGRLTPGFPERVRRIGCRFTRPLYAGTPITTLIWSCGEGRALWRVARVSDGAVVIDRGIFEFGDAVTDGSVPSSDRTAEP
jgi:acyl dehydratase